MAVPSISTNFADLLDPRFQKIFNDEYRQLPDRVGEFFDIVRNAPTTADLRYSQVGTLGDIPEFTGTVTYLDNFQGYDVTITPKEYVGGYQIERKLYEDDQFSVMDGKPRSLATSLNRTRQKHAASLFVNAFSVDSTWLTHSEGVALCSNSHTTTSGASTAVGFDNLSTASLSAVAVSASRTTMRQFRGDQGERINVQPDMILVAVDREDDLFEITQSQGKPDTANNNANAQGGGRWTGKSWDYLDDANDWFMLDSALMKQWQKWFQRISSEFAMVEDFETFIGKWRLRDRYGLGWINWRHVTGHQVS